MRKQGWESILSQYLEKSTLRRFKWGKFDCLIFVSNAVRLMTGIDPMSKKKRNDPKTIRGLYKTEDEARMLISKFRRSMPNIMDVHFKRINPAFAGKGDVVLMKLSEGNTFGVVGNRGIAFFKTSDAGLIQKPFVSAKFAWRVE